MVVTGDVGNCRAGSFIEVVANHERSGDGRYLGSGGVCDGGVA